MSVGSAVARTLSNVLPKLESYVERAIKPDSVFTEDALALRFADEHLNDRRYVNVWGRWLLWDGSRWVRDEKMHIFSDIRALCRTAARECNEEKAALKLADASTIMAIERLARSDQRLAAGPDDWDKEPHLINTPLGVVDLRDGNIRPARAEDMMMKITSVGPNRECAALIWTAFLARIFNNDQELIGYIQRLLGYGLTGSVKEEMFAFFYGVGMNGKSKLIDTVASIMGDYHVEAPSEMFTVTRSEQHSTDMAGLQGARLVTATEVQTGRTWNEVKIKAVTGGDPIRCRFMRQDFFTYQPQFTLVIAGNDKPSLQSVGVAMRRRFHLVPFEVSIPEEERDYDLLKKLLNEAPGILAWIIEGSVMWHQQGLAPPAKVIDATKAYFADEDVLSSWIEEETFRDESGFETATDLYVSFKSYATRSGEDAGKAKSFKQRLCDRGFKQDRRNYGRGFVGIRLKEKYQGEEAREDSNLPLRAHV